MNAHNRFVAAFLVACALPAQTVDVVKVISKKSERKAELPGEFMPYQSVAVRPKVTGFVERVNVDRGSVVKEGQMLAVLVAPELKSQRAEAEAKVQSIESQRAEAEAKVVAAQGTYDKLKAASQTPGVVAGNDLLIAQKAVDAAQAQVHAYEGSAKAARSSVEALKDMEEYLRVTAPFSGVITERNIHPGALVGPGAASPPMLQLEQNSRLRLVVAVPEADVSGIEPGARVTFTVPAYPGETFSGPIARDRPLPGSEDALDGCRAGCGQRRRTAGSGDVRNGAMAGAAAETIAFRSADEHCDNHRANLRGSRSRRRCGMGQCEPGSIQWRSGRGVRTASRRET